MAESWPLSSDRLLFGERGEIVSIERRAAVPELADLGDDTVLDVGFFSAHRYHVLREYTIQSPQAPSNVGHQMRIVSHLQITRTPSLNSTGSKYFGTSAS